MKKLLFLALFGALTSAFGQNFEWAKATGGSLNEDNGRAVAIDASGNVYTTGMFSGTVDFDPSGAILNISSKGATDIFIQKFDASGNLLWAKAVGGTQEDIGNSIVVDPATGSVYMSGQFRGTADFDPSGATANYTSNGDYDICVLKLDASGNFVWARAVGGTGWDYAFASALDASGNIITTGVFQNYADLDPSGAVVGFTSYGLNDSFIQKLTPSGDLIWVKRFGGSLHDDVSAIAIDGIGDIYISGAFQGTSDFNPSTTTNNLSSNGDFDIFIVKLDGAGNFIWAESFGGGSSDKSFTLAVDASSNVIASGYFSQTVDFDPSGSTANLISQGGEDVFILKLNAVGNYVWAKSFGGSANDLGLGIAVDASGYITLSGSFQSTVDFDPSNAVYNISSLGGTDAFVLSTDPGGSFEYLLHMGGIGTDHARALQIKNDQIAIAGSFTGTCDFDILGTGFDMISTAGSTDIYTQKLSINKFSIEESYSLVTNVYPNPTQALITIHFNTPADNADLFIYGQNGQLLMQRNNISDNATTLDVSTLSNGIYYVELRENGQTSAIRFVKN